MTLDYVVWTIQKELRQGMAQQQRRLSEETLGTIEEGLAPVHELIEKVENKVTKGIQAALTNVQGLSEGQEELERSIGQMATGAEILRSRVFAIEEKIAELERRAGPCSFPAPSGLAKLKYRAGTPHAPSSMSSCILAPSEVELPKSRFEELGVDPTSYGTVVIPTTTSVTWGSPGTMSSTKEGPKCRRCIQGPSWHGGHDRSDPACALHGSTVRNGGEALAYLRRHQAKPTTPTTRSTGSKPTASTTRGSTKASTTRSTKRTLTISTTRGQAKQGPPRPRQPQTHSSSSGSSSSSDSATQPPSGEQLPLPATTGTQHEGTVQGLAQPVSPGPWGPQDEEFEQEAWSSILGYVPGIPHQEKPPRKNKNPGEQAEGAQKTTAEEQAAGPPPAAQPPEVSEVTNLTAPTRGVLRGLSPLAAGAARAIPQATHVSVKHDDGVYYQKAAQRGSEHEAQRTHDSTEPTKTTLDNHNNCDDYLPAPGPAFETQPPPALLVPPGGQTPQHRGLHPDQDAFEDAYPTDEARDQPHEARGDPPGTAKDDAEEPDWSRDSQDEADEGMGDDIANYDMPGPSHGTWGTERPAEPDGAPPSRPASNHGSREALSAEEMRTERNRRARAEWREWRRQQRRRGGDGATTTPPQRKDPRHAGGGSCTDLRRIEYVENKITEGIKTTLDDIQELTEGQEKLEKFLSQTIAGTELLQQRILALEEKLAEFQHVAGPCTLPAPVSRTKPQHRTGIPQVPLNLASCSLALSEVGFFSSLEERSPNPTSNGTVAIPTTTSATWSSSGRTTPMTEKQKCRRCTQGPSWHGGHNRADPSCILHGSTVRNGGEALAYLRRHHASSTGTTTRSSGSTPASRFPLEQQRRQQHRQQLGRGDSTAQRGTTNITDAFGDPGRGSPSRPGPARFARALGPAR